MMAEGRTTRSRGRAPAQEREWISLRQLEVRLALSGKQIQREMKEGMPHQRNNGVKLEFPWPDVRIWRDERIRTLAESASTPDGKEGGGGLLGAKIRRELAEAELAELELAKQRGELVEVAGFERAIEEAFGRVRARLLSLPPKLGAQGVGHKSPRAAQAALEPLIYELLEELHRADDVPPESDDDGDELAA